MGNFVPLRWLLGDISDPEVVYSTVTGSTVSAWEFVALVLLNSKNRFEFILYDEDLADVEFLYQRDSVNADPDSASKLWDAMTFDLLKGDGSRPISGVAPFVFIRARQGHSVNADPTSLYIHKITAEEAEGLNPVVHGTTFANHRSIESRGLIPGGTSGTVYRAAAHFLACGLAKDNASEAAMSSLRQRGEVF